MIASFKCFQWVLKIGPVGPIEAYIGQIVGLQFMERVTVTYGIISSSYVTMSQPLSLWAGINKMAGSPIKYPAHTAQWQYMTQYDEFKKCQKKSYRGDL